MLAVGHDALDRRDFLLLELVDDLIASSPLLLLGGAELVDDCQELARPIGLEVDTAADRGEESLIRFELAGWCTHRHQHDRAVVVAAAAVPIS
jgi:hypothetical protein